MKNLTDLTGQKFGKLTALERVENDKWGHHMWLCICDCGNKTIVNSNKGSLNNTN